METERGSLGELAPRVLGIAARWDWKNVKRGREHGLEAGEVGQVDVPVGVEVEGGARR